MIRDSDLELHLADLRYSAVGLYEAVGMSDLIASHIDESAVGP